MKILILASNPRKDLNLDHEIRDLRSVIEQSRNRQQLEVEDALAVRVGDLQDLLFKYEPHIVHFCGHGGGQPGLVFEGNDGKEQWVRTDALRELFRLFSSRVGCVVLNACYSGEQANEIVNHIDYVIGMNQEIRDDAAIVFAKGFYLALGYDCSIEEAYEFGCNAIQLEITGSSIVRSAAAEAIRKVEVADAVATTAIPEHLKPILKKREGASSRNRWKTLADQPLSQDKKEELQLELAQELISNRLGRAIANQSQPTPSNSLSSPPTQTVVTLRQSTHRLTKLFLGGLITCLLATGGIYGYRYWQSTQVQQNPLQQAIELANQGQLEAAIVTLNQISANSPLATQSGGYLEAWSARLLQRAEEYYEEGDVDEAVRLANVIPVNSPIHSRAQAAISDWNRDKQTLENIQIGLDTNWDVTGGRRLLEAIKSPGLRKQAEERIAEIEKKIPSVPPTTVPDPTPPQPDPQPRDTEPDRPAATSWLSYEYAWLSSREVTQADLEGKSASELRIMKNSIYAKYGRIFKDPELQAYFSQQSWYEPIKANVDDLLTSMENWNVNKIKKFQTKMGYQ